MLRITSYTNNLGQLELIVSFKRPQGWMTLMKNKDISKGPK